jgi:hypothetical protein
MSDENILIPKARYEKMLEKLTKYEERLAGDDKRNKIKKELHNDDDNREAGGRTIEDIFEENAALRPPGINMADLDVVVKKKKKKLKRNGATKPEKTTKFKNKNKPRKRASGWIYI